MYFPFVRRFSYKLKNVSRQSQRKLSFFSNRCPNQRRPLGTRIKLITADEAYHDNDGSLYEETGVVQIMPPAADTKLLENVDPEKQLPNMENI
jgi:hypothetical protein